MNEILANIIKQVLSIINTEKYTEDSKKRRILEAWHQSFADVDDIYLKGLQGVLTRTIAADLTPYEILEYIEWWVIKLNGKEIQ